MDRDFFIKLIFATHKVADLLGKGELIKSKANILLANLLLFCEDNPISLEQKRNILPRTLRAIDNLKVLLAEEKTSKDINPANFLVLERELSKLPVLLIDYLEQKKREVSGDATILLEAKTEQKQETLPLRQKKILEFLRTNKKAQVWELQKILPEVTKRTLRRDLDRLIKNNLIERKGQWNNVFYQLVDRTE